MHLSSGETAGGVRDPETLGMSGRGPIVDQRPFHSRARRPQRSASSTCPTKRATRAAGNSCWSLPTASPTWKALSPSHELKRKTW